MTFVNIEGIVVHWILLLKVKVANGDAKLRIRYAL